jgi:uncharacterized peroxidase-related enzyme
MARIQPVDPTTADIQTTQLLDTVRKKIGAVPNLIATMAHSPAVASAYLGFSQALAGGKLPAPLREQIALAVGQSNTCNYCVSAHSFLGKKAGLSDADVCDARQGTAGDPKTRTALAFARKLVQDRGRVGDDDLAAVRQAGYSDGEIAEIVAHVALNVFTNYFNHVADTDVDFPAAPALSAA